MSQEDEEMKWNVLYSNSYNTLLKLKLKKDQSQ